MCEARWGWCEVECGRGGQRRRALLRFLAGAPRINARRQELSRVRGAQQARRYWLRVEREGEGEDEGECEGRQQEQEEQQEQ